MLFLLTVGELYLSPVGLSFVTQARCDGLLTGSFRGQSLCRAVASAFPNEMRGVMPGVCRLLLHLQVSPKELTSQLMGVWFLSSFFGNYMAGAVLRIPFAWFAACLPPRGDHWAVLRPHPCCCRVARVVLPADVERGVLGRLLRRRYAQRCAAASLACSSPSPGQGSRPFELRTAADGACMFQRRLVANASSNRRFIVARGRDNHGGGGEAAAACVGGAPSGRHSRRRVICSGGLMITERSYPRGVTREAGVTDE